MKFTCDRSELNTNLSLAIRAVPSRPTHPILGNFLITADDRTQKVWIRAFDLSLGVRVSFSAQVGRGGEIALPAKLLNDIVSKLPDGEITIVRKEEKAVAKLTSDRGQYYQVQGMGASEFPRLPEIETGKVMQLSAGTLLQALKGTLFAASNDETKQVLAGVHLTVAASGWEFAATDGHRLGVVEVPPPDEKDEVEASREFEVTIPAPALQELTRIVGKLPDEDIVTLKCDDVQAIFEFGGGQCLVSRTLEGAYPNYRQLIPRQFETQMNVDRVALLEALDRVALLAKVNNVVKLTLDTQTSTLFLSAETADLGNGKEEIDVAIIGKSIELGMNAKYLSESLRNLQAPGVKMQLNAPTSPVVLTPLGEVKTTHLVMPVQIRN